MTLLELDDYLETISLDRPFTPSAPPAEPDRFGELARTALRHLANESSAAPLALTSGHVAGMTDAEAHRALRAVLNVRPPTPLPHEAEAALDALLGGRRRTRAVVDPHDLPTIRPGAALVPWQGDLTDLAADTIVNAANSAMLGCFQPLHACIDNAIHSASGLRFATTATRS